MPSQEKSNDSSGGPASRAQNLEDDLSWYWDQFAREMNPVGISEAVMVKDLALRAANLAALGEAVVAARRQTLDSISQVVGPMMASEKFHRDASCLLGSLASGRIEQLERQSLKNLAGFYQGLHAIHQLQDRRRAQDAADSIDPRFTSEQACLSYLVRHQVKHGGLCSACGATETKYWIESRRCLECQRCGGQIGVRTGTLMEQSPLRLTVWFAAIRLVLQMPTLPASDLAAKVKISRIATARSVLTRTLKAAADPNRSELLAGLDRLYIDT